MRRPLDSTDTTAKYGRLTILRMVGRTKDHREVVLCECECGNSFTSQRRNITSGSIVSCGCLRRERSAARLTIHGLRETPEYKTWQSMCTRCHNPKSKGFTRITADAGLPCVINGDTTLRSSYRMLGKGQWAVIPLIESTTIAATNRGMCGGQHASSRG